VISARRPARLPALGIGAVLLVALTGCQMLDAGDNLVAGKQAFVERCGSCHVLSRAGTTGVSGPNLDEAFRQALRDGIGPSTIQGVVRGQIADPARSRQLDPDRLERTVAMPADLVTGELAEDVAAYVASAAAKPGEDTGQLAQIGVPESTRVAEAQDGRLEITADPSGALRYLFGSAEAPAGPLTITSQNESSVDHNIALEGNGVREIGPIVKDDGTSEIEVRLQAGEYTFFCSVPGHRQGGMEGRLIVE
jgi:uncharacterized cupredoxin-like copper-binding protein